MRDSLIWESYVNYSKINNLINNCVFITKNTNDFTKELINEWEGLTHYQTIWDIIPNILASNNLNSKLYEDLIELKIDKEQIFEYKESHLTPLINSMLLKYIETIPLSYFDPDFRDGDINLIGNFSYGEIEKIKKYINQNSIFIQFKLKVYQTCVVYQYNYIYEDGFPLPDGIGGDYEMDIDLIIISKYEAEDNFYDFEIDSIELNEIY
ncbi:hypothetical protein CH381_25340 [Leptospira sp. mixed culture ATI2-C-A1]|nr:hypothetical protein CH381_25340 [Leptospira sp. mixed culture ATI2-C-A1]